jgi:hypothetical protein
MKNQNRVIAFPKKKDFLIPGELLKIEVNHNSFVVFFQFEGDDDFEHQLVISTITFPIKYLVKFFKRNGSVDRNYFVNRRKELLAI